MFGSLKIIILIVIVVAVASAVGGFFLYHKSIISDLNDVIAEKQEIISVQKEQIAGLIIDTERLKFSNSSLESEIKRKSDETKEAFAEITRLRVKDAQSAVRLNDIESMLRDRNRMDRLQAIRETRKSSLLLRLMDRNIKCYAENFDKVDGKCIRGKWVPTGERFLPESLTDPSPGVTTNE